MNVALCSIIFAVDHLFWSYVSVLSWETDGGGAVAVGKAEFGCVRGRGTLW